MIPGSPSDRVARVLASLRRIDPETGASRPLDPNDEADQAWLRSRLNRPNPGAARAHQEAA